MAGLNFEARLVWTSTASILHTSKVLALDCCRLSQEKIPTIDLLPHALCSEYTTDIAARYDHSNRLRTIQIYSLALIRVIFTINQHTVIPNFGQNKGYPPQYVIQHVFSPIIFLVFHCHTIPLSELPNTEIPDRRMSVGMTELK